MLFYASIKVILLTLPSNRRGALSELCRWVGFIEQSKMDYAEGGIIKDSIQLNFGITPKEFDLSLSRKYCYKHFWGIFEHSLIDFLLGHRHSNEDYASATFRK